VKVDYSKFKVAELKEMAEREMIPGYKSMRKDELIAALEALG
jgi:hypothetical protein